MLSLHLIIIYFVLGITSKYMIEGLQCYVCEDCNEYEDFKELHICGEISTITTKKPITLPEVLENVNNGTTTTTTVKPVHEDTEEYIYDDSLESHDDGGSNFAQHNQRTKTRTENRTTPKPTNTIRIAATTPSSNLKPLPVSGDEDYLEYDLPSTGKENNAKNPIKTEITKTNIATTTNKPNIKQQTTTKISTVTTTTSSLSSATTKISTSSKPIQLTGDEDYLDYDENPATTKKPAVKQQESTTNTTAVPLTPNNLSTPLANSSLTNFQPIKITDDYDYLEYDAPSAREQQNIPTKSKFSRSSLLKINEPVCYMIKYNVNNTVITNRGCTTFINANKYLTCQSLYNGAPMTACRVCSSDGCNKFHSDDDSDEDHGIIFNASNIPQRLSATLILVITIIIFVLF